MVLYPNKLPESERVCSGICTKLKYFSSGNTLAESAQYYEHEYIFKFVFEVSSACSAVFRD